MGRIFLTNVLRSIILCAIAFVVSCGLNLLVCYLFNLIFHTKLTSFWVYLLISAGISSGIMSIVGKEAKEGTYEIFGPGVMLLPDDYWIQRIKSGKKIKYSKIGFSLLLHLLIAAAMVAVFILKFDEIDALLTDAPENVLKNTGIYMITPIVTIFITQLGYYFAYRSMYKEGRCDDCRHALCLVYEGVDEVREYTTSEIQQKEGYKYIEFEMEGHRYSANGGLLHSSRKVKQKYTTYKCRCAICSEDHYQFEYTEEKGAWSDWH